MYFGIYCEREEYPQEHDRLRDLTAKLTSREEPNEWWPWYEYDRREVNFKHPARHHLEMLADNVARAEYVGEIVDGLNQIWGTISDYAVGSSQGS